MQRPFSVIKKWTTCNGEHVENRTGKNGDRKAKTQAAKNRETGKTGEMNIYSTWPY
jgi:hypothetical protein